MNIVRIKKTAVVCLFFFPLCLCAQDCVIPITVQLDEDFSQLPTPANSSLYETLCRIASNNGLTTESPTNQFVLTAHCDVIDKSVLPGPPVKIVNNIALTLYVADIFTKKRFSSTYVSLNGVGASEQKSLINAFQQLSPKTSTIESFINDSKKKILRYYDTLYPEIIKEAKRMVVTKKYEEALALLLSIPNCSEGAAAAQQYALQVYQMHIDRVNLFLYNNAKAIWSSSPIQSSAVEACSMLAQIDPEASSYNEAQQLMSEIKAKIKDDIHFEMRKKYSDRIELEKERISSARAIGVAYGKGQKEQTTNLMWLK